MMKIGKKKRKGEQQVRKDRRENKVKKGGNEDINIACKEVKVEEGRYNI